MSRIGKLPINIPSGVKIAMNGAEVSVQGPKGKLAQKLPEVVDIKVAADVVTVERRGDDKSDHSMQGLTRTLIANMVEGVSNGFERVLEITGVGYRAEASGKNLNLSLGYSHPIDYPLPEGITVEVEKQTKIMVRGIDKQLVGATAAKIRSFRPPEPYKGKGVRYADERILRKAGKAGKK